MKKLLILLFSLLISFNSYAINVYGYISCGSFLNGCDMSKTHIDCQTQTYFTTGYISGLAVSEDKSFSESINTDNIKYALIKYCRENPLKDTHLGAENIFDQL